MIFKNRYYENIYLSNSNQRQDQELKHKKSIKVYKHWCFFYRIKIHGMRIYWGLQHAHNVNRVITPLSPMNEASSLQNFGVS